MTWQQYEVLLDSFAHRGAGRHVAQLAWCWHGPLDTERFTAAWQSVTDREIVLRAAVAWDTFPRIVFHERAHAEVDHCPAGTDWDELLERDRLRGFDLRRPGPLRITLVDAGEPGERRTAATHVLLTFHHALLDAWSVFLLMEEFCRAYLADGVLPGGERRPDLRDWTRWLDHQDTRPARDFWSGAARDTSVAVLPARPGPATAQRGSGRAEVRLSAAEADRIYRWAAARAVPDSCAVQAVWALLLYRAAGVRGPAPVGFGVTVSGRGITLDSVERLVGPLRTSVPMAVRVDPESSVGGLLTALRDRALDMAAYEWVPTGQIREWTGRDGRSSLMESQVAWENTPRPLPDLSGRLADAGIRLEPRRATDGHTSLPAALLAHRAADGSLTLTVAHDRARLSDDEAWKLAGHCARLLRRLPSTTGEATVADVLRVLEGDPPPRAAPPPRGHPPRAVRLRPYSTGGRPGVDRAGSES
ncbi:condensation domain-containing protein [Streptomyces rochei]|uniref:condensation domain-containing protein n=1 Tax=Streptomyces rochei TaxID=1928 RepID=UPI0036320B5E